jgi:hypothetical protein
MADPPPGFRLFGARVRGKKHKHDGTNCDDWFEFAQAGPWTVIAVSDGAGSKKFSRVGAKAACTAAVRELSERLAGHEFAPRPAVADWQDVLQPGTTAPDIEAVRTALRDAMTQAHGAVEAAAREREGKPEYEACLNRPIEVNDLSCTLLLAVHRTVEVDGKDLGFVMACQVGDGITGAVARGGTVHPIGTADSGGYSGETEFLTSDGKTDAEFLARKTAVFLGPLQALMVMTDGVADDYFPADAHLGRLWTDLVVNGIPELSGPDEAAVRAALGATLVKTPADLAGLEYAADAGLVEASPSSDPVRLRSSAAFAERLGVSVDDLLRKSALLWAGRDALPGATAQDRLRLWLDAYHVRGSFDDRTLVVLHREALP